MADHGPIDERPPHYEETTDPRNPPSSVLRPAARRSAVWTYVGGIVVLFLIVTAALVYWGTGDRGGDPELDRAEQSAVGTGGEPIPEGDSPGGFDPQPRADSTRDELERRGAGERPQGPMPGLTSSAPLNELGSLFEDPASEVVGRRIDVRDVEVDGATQGNGFWIKDGDARAAVVAPGGTPAVRAGQHVDVSGTVESDGNDSVRIRATRVDVK
jgi:hypothetical protein